MTAVLDLAFDEWVAEARRVAVMDELGRRGVTLKRSGTEMVGPCPVCGGRDRFGVHLRKGLWHCRGSQRGGDAIALVQYLDGADFVAACETLTGRAAPRGDAGTRASAEELAAREAERLAKAAAEAASCERYREAERARLYRDWRASMPLVGTPGEAYLRTRCIPDPHSPVLRFRADARYYHGAEEDERGFRRQREIYRGPALVAAITGADGLFRGLHTTWIDLDTGRKGKAEILDPETGEVLPAKKVRGSQKGGRILLVPAPSGVAETVYAAEGIETTLSVWFALAGAGWDLSRSAFMAGISLGNLAGNATETVRHPTAMRADKAGRMRAVRVPGPVPDMDAPAMPVPPECTTLVLAGDGDSEPFLTRMAMQRAEARHAAPGRLVRTIWPPDGKDFNDLLMEASEQPGGSPAMASGARNEGQVYGA